MADEFHKAVAESVKEEEKKKRRSRTRLEEEKLRQKKKAMAEEYLNLVGQENEEKGAKWTIEFQSQAEKQEKEAEEIAKDKLKQSRRGKKEGYVFQLAKELYRRAMFVDWPKGYKWRVRYSDHKIALIFRHPSGRWYGKGIKPTSIPMFDLYAVQQLVTQCENTVDFLEGKLAWQKEKKHFGSGFYLPNGLYYQVSDSDKENEEG